MNRNVTASFGLSVLIVLFFAVALYQPDSPPPRPLPESPGVPVAGSETRPPTPAGPPLLPTVAARPHDPVGPKTPPLERSTTDLPRRAAATPRPLPVVHRPRPPVERREPRGAFTESRAGESLADVAGRTYGTPDAAQTLWLANRDILDRPDVTLPAGTLLRTP
jgi:hypothetical protein